ncbi:MAG: hypothetical protein U9Q83_02680, partial [Bacteroidota bacterium]|nr:hypothetical protein [Bacteroidota bacterium]
TSHSKIQTNRLKYGVDNPSQSNEIKEKKMSTTIKNYGVNHNSQASIIKEKKRKTNLERYGAETPLQNKEILTKLRKTNLERYGAETPLQNKEILTKLRKTNLERYGAENVQQNLIVRQKTITTCNVLYGGNTPMSHPEIKQKSRDASVKSFFSKKMKSLASIVKPLFAIDDYISTDKSYEWQCMKCDNVFESHLQDGRIPRCYECYPSMNTGISKGETELFDMINNSHKIQSDRTVLNGKELDIYIPDKNIAIEFNGIYWHSELNGKDKNYHLNKTKQCKEKGIQLIHIFETEWYEKQDVVLSLICAKLGQFKKRIYGRKTEVKVIPSKRTNEFLEANHLQGKDTSSIKLGLFYDDELVSVMTFGKSRYNKNYQYEMHRFCNKLDHQIIGGASKLWKHFINCYKPKSVITYADRRYSDGTFYEKIGFYKLRESAPNHFYFKGSSGLMSRIAWQKHKLLDKLDIFDNNLTAWENMQINGYDRIYDCGNHVFGWKEGKSSFLY